MNEVTTKVFIEYEQLKAKHNKLRSFLASDGINSLTPKNKEFLIVQYTAVKPYLDILKKRLDHMLQENED